MHTTHIYLIGLMGAGKTTVGRRLARLLSCRFIDTDQALEARTGVSVSHIFEIEGEHGFREREARLLAELGRAPERGGARRGAVIATGGGAVLRDSNRRLMRQSGRVVYLRASLELLCQRLQGCHTRPLLSAPDPERKIAQLLEERAPLYTAEADLIVDVGGESAAGAAQRIYHLLQGDEAGKNGQH